MIALEKIHSGYVYGRRVSVLANAIECLIPTSASVLDLGCGDGLIGHIIAQQRKDIKIFGADVLLRSRTFIPAISFDGQKLPFESEKFDMVMMVDVLHHAQDIQAVLLEASRVAKKYLILKDHLSDRILAKSTLRLMDTIGNLRYGVYLPYNYLSMREWQELFRQCDLKIEQWNEDLGLYPWWADWLFGRSLHFLTCLEKKQEWINPDPSS